MNKTTEIKLDVDTIEPSTTLVPQVGMRYPDGSIRWGTDGRVGVGVSFPRLAANIGSEIRIWESDLADRAKSASVDLETYKAQHRLVKRTVVVAILEVEDVK